MTIVIILDHLDIYDKHYNQSYAYAYAHLQINLQLPIITIIPITNANDHFMKFTNIVLTPIHTNNYYDN